MSRKIIRHDQARQDLLDEAYYIAEDDLNASDRFLQATEAAFQRLADLPGIGVRRDYQRPELQGIQKVVKYLKVTLADFERTISKEVSSQVTWNT